MLEETPDLIGSWITYERVGAGDLGPASLDVLMAGATPRSAGAEPAVVDIRTLLYRGDAARRRAAELRAAARNVSGEELRALVDEVCDLVDLALDPV